jgi:hypothetical protein
MDLSVSPVGQPTGGENNEDEKMDPRLRLSGMTMSDGCPITTVGHDKL